MHFLNGSLDEIKHNLFFTERDEHLRKVGELRINDVIEAEVRDLDLSVLKCVNCECISVAGYHWRSVFITRHTQEFKVVARFDELYYKFLTDLVKLHKLNEIITFYRFN